MADCLYICGHELGSGKVWRFAPGDTVLTDVSDATVEASSRIECVSWDSVNNVLYAGTSDGKILKYTGGAWAVEYNSGSAIPILSIAYFEGYWYALRSYRPLIDAGTGIKVYRQTAPGTWVETYSTAAPQRACSLHPAPSADDGPHMLMGMVDTGVVKYTTDGSTWTTDPGLSQGSDPIECFWYDLGSGTTRYLVRNVDNGNHWGKANMADSWLGWGSGSATRSTYGQHSAWRHEDTDSGQVSYFHVDYYYHRVFKHQPGGWIAGYEADLPGGSAAATQIRTAFAEIGGILYVCVECATVASLHHRDDVTETWTRDIDTADQLLLDMVLGDDLSGVSEMVSEFDDPFVERAVDVMKVVDNP